MNITVILCTYNRCGVLARALESVAHQTLAQSIEWEVLVVDNNSGDQTRAVVEDFCLRHPGRFRYLFEPRQGKSYALNAGIQASTGEILAFIDDDVIAEPTWLRNLTVPLERGEWAAVGGRIPLQRNFTQPSWLPLDGPYSMAGMLTEFDLGVRAGKLHQPPFGTNMAIRKKMFEKYGEFRTDMGPRPGSEVRGEDVEFVRRLLTAKEPLWYEPSAIVHHPVPENRLHKQYFLAFWFDYGRTTIREEGQRPDIWGIPRPYLTMLKHTIVIAPIKTLQWLLALNPQVRFYRKCWVWCTAGEVVEIYRRWFVASSQKQNPSPNMQTGRHV